MPLDLAAMLDGAPPPFARAAESVLPGQLDAARRILAAADARAAVGSLDACCSPELERIRWFPLPGEAVERLRGAPRHAAA